MTSYPARQWFADASDTFLGLVDLTPSDQLDSPGLGQWSVRSLIGHTCRAYLTIEAYLTAATVSSDLRSPTIGSPQEYFHAAFASLGDPDDVAARGVAAGQALGDRPVERAKEIGATGNRLVAGTDDNALVATPVGVLRFIEYLPTRAFELTVHSLDLAAALGVTPPHPPSTIRAAIDLAASLAEPSAAVTILRALTGRAAIPAGFTTLA